MRVSADASISGERNVVMDLQMEETTTTSVDRFPKSTDRKRKRRKTETSSFSPPSHRWRTVAEHSIYSSKLLEALRHVRHTTSGPVSSLPRTRAIREAADRALAFAARGRTRWSRAILLSSRRNLRLKATRRRLKKPACPSKIGSNLQQHYPTETKPLVPSLERKAKVLGKLVPGCRKLSFPALLDETSDYIAALQMQVQAMSALAELLSSPSPSGINTDSTTI